MLRDKLETVARRSKNNNIAIHGVKETDDEIVTLLKDDIHKLIKEKLQIELEMEYELTNIHRICKKLDYTDQEQRSRPLIISLHSYLRKEEVLANSSKLKGTKIYLNENLSIKELVERKILLKHLKTAAESETANQSEPQIKQPERSNLKPAAEKKIITRSARKL